MSDPTPSEELPVVEVEGNELAPVLLKDWCASHGTRPLPMTFNHLIALIHKLPSGAARRVINAGLDAIGQWDGYYADLERERDELKALVGAAERELSLRRTKARRLGLHAAKKLRASALTTTPKRRRRRGKAEGR